MSTRLHLRLDERRAIFIVAALSGILHLLMAGSLPLIITPDGGEYIRSALDLDRPDAAWSMPNRTPGYPVFLRATFVLFGVGAGGILIAQNVLATATVVLLALAACRLAGPAIGLAIGVLAAFEPWPLMLANYALTETLTIFCVVLAATLVVTFRRPTPFAAIAVGVALGVACLIRPAVPSMAAFFAAAWALGVVAERRRRVALAAVLVVAYVATVGPWLAYNASRGVRGFAAGGEWVLWYGVTMFGLLDRTQAPNPALAALTERHLAGGIADYPVMRVIIDSGALESAEPSRALGDWARASVAANPLAYAASVPFALLWQLNAGIAGKPPMYDELPFFAQRLTWDTHQPPRGASPNFQNAGHVPRPQAFTVAWHGGVMQSYMKRVAGLLRGVPQLPLFLCAVAATLVAALRREWWLAVLLAGTLAFVLAHAALLLPIARHAMPVTAVWYLALAYLLRELAAWRRAGRAG